MTIDATERDLAGHRAAPSASTPTDVAAADVTRSFLDAVFDTSIDATVIVDEVGCIRYVTPGTTDLLGYSRDAAVGRSVFDFLHPDDVTDAAGLFVRRLEFTGADQGKELRIRHARGTTVRTLATASLLPEDAARLGVGTCAIRLRALGTDVEAERELSLQRRIVVGEYTNSLAADLMTAPGPDDVLERVDVALREIALLSGADIAAVCLERPDGSGIEVTASSLDVNEAPLHISAERDVTASLLAAHLSIDDLATRRPDLADVFGCTAHALLSTPFEAGTRRGALVLLHVRPGVWWDSDSDLVRGAANVIGRALHAAWSEQLLALTYRKGPIAFSIHSWTGDLIDCNDRYLELFGLDRTSARRLARVSSIPEPGRSELITLVTQLRAGAIDRLDIELELERGDGTPMWVRTNGVRLRLPGSGDSVILTSYADITSRQRQRMELEYAAHHDPLTGLANRTALWQAIGSIHQADGRLPMLLIVDLDRFKHVNDTHGHRVGDHVLQVIARRLLAHVRAGDVVARLGGDEFAIAMPAMTLADAEATAERIRVAVEEPIVVDGVVVNQTLSIGIAEGCDGSDLAELMVWADRALFAAKRRGRNCQVVFHIAMTDDALADVQLEHELQAAIHAGELDVFFQPEFALDDRRIVGAEALVRWHHPTRGLLPAGDFIAVAERTGLIDDIGRFSLREATRAFTACCARVGRDDLILRVNISAREFARTELSDIVRSALERSGLDPAHLCLEMTETTLMDAPEIALATFATLHDIGVQFAIDDFGTGYSSFAYLKRFPVDVLKIDRAFVDDIDHDGESRAIVSSILGLARTLALQVIAEGVEREEQLDALVALGCDRAQGYLVAPALPAGEFVDALERNSVRP